MPRTLALPLLLLFALPAWSQGGYRTKKFPRLGLELPVANDYDPIPVQPTERFVNLEWALETEKVGRRDQRPDGARRQRKTQERRQRWQSAADQARRDDGRNSQDDPDRGRGPEPDASSSGGGFENRARQNRPGHHEQ